MQTITPGMDKQQVLLCSSKASLEAQMVKNLPTKQEILV